MEDDLYPGELIRDIKNFEELYQITNFGRIWSVRRQIWVKLSVNKYGYYQITLYNRNIVKTFTVHKLVLIHFDREPEWYEETRHLDNNRKNNHIDNLKWSTHIENMKDQIANGTHSRGENNGSSYLNNKQVEEIRAKYKTGNYSQRELAKEYNVSHPTIGNIVRNETWEYV